MLPLRLAAVREAAMGIAEVRSVEPGDWGDRGVEGAVGGPRGWRGDRQPGAHPVPQVRRRFY